MAGLAPVAIGGFFCYQGRMNTALSLFGNPSSLESQGIEVGVLQEKPQADALTGEPAHVASALPGDHALDLVADDLHAVRQGESRDRAARQG